ncbi:MAG: bifunctional 5,10-methylenetetrahydrofolate dehydrogenase/5,10-methenyltetrahydrofolate cyclohydrolase [Chloroflexia bacterium]|nr:bifunctional 5,10-methylenetetrahydrofolate dehydrogenase/5,10-methenyltetrahydrofolate cyclohydrolase [Chloroflexia bacterium]
MTATILDGKSLAKELQAELKSDVEAFVQDKGFAPTMAIVRAGSDPASEWYARTIVRTMERYGLQAVEHGRPADIAQADLLALVAQLSADPGVHGIMIQEPLPKGMDRAAVIAALDPRKDVDGVHPANAGLLAQAPPAGRGEGAPFFVPATPAGGMEILRRYDIPLSGKNAVVLGRSNIVGKPMALLLLRQNATVTVCHSRTADLPAVCRQADVLAAAVGRAHMVQADWIRPGAVVIDFGTNPVKPCPACGAHNAEDAAGCACGQPLDEVKVAWVGDVDFEAAEKVAGMITPVPGGTGPMTNVMLMRNLLAAARRS